jgi:hypothetical protein
LSVKEKIRILAQQYALRLDAGIQKRMVEMQNDDLSHFLIYRVLGVSEQEGKMIDVYQNKGRFLYRYAGAFLEEATKICFKEVFPSSGSVKIPNQRAKRPKTFEIDCLVGQDAIEIKWKDATTDGDHITKEHTRLLTIADAGYIPVRLMFFSPNRVQAIRIQAALATMYQGVGGFYYAEADAWDYVLARTGIDLLSILEEIAQESLVESAQESLEEIAQESEEEI